MQTTPPQNGSHSISDLSRIAQDLQIRKGQVENVVQLLDEGNTVPFITRYRKERTGGLNEDVIRRILDRIVESRHLADRKLTVLKSIENQGKLTEQLRHEIQIAETSKRLEDLYLPYKPKKRTLATEAREKGLEPLAEAVWKRDEAVRNLPEVLAGMVNPEKQLNSPDDILTGVGHILAEQFSEMADVRALCASLCGMFVPWSPTKSSGFPMNRAKIFGIISRFANRSDRFRPIAFSRSIEANARIS